MQNAKGKMRLPRTTSPNSGNASPRFSDVVLLFSPASSKNPMNMRLNNGVKPIKWAYRGEESERREKQLPETKRVVEGIGSDWRETIRYNHHNLTFEMCLHPFKESHL